jgi:uncharacterized protein YbbK (DUF523 family)
MVYLPPLDQLAGLQRFTPEKPLKLLVSACLGGTPCGVDGSTNGEYPWIRKLIALPNVRTVSLCPEHYSFGTPRATPDIADGTGFDVLDGRARVLNEKGEDWTDGMIRGAQAMLELARASAVDLAVLMDMSAACGSQVISDGSRFTADRKYRQGPGVAAALLLRNGFRVISQRDFRALERLYELLDPTHAANPAARDHHETDWYIKTFGARTFK